MKASNSFIVDQNSNYGWNGSSCSKKVTKMLKVRQNQSPSINTPDWKRREIRNWF